MLSMPSDNQFSADSAGVTPRHATDIRSRIAAARLPALPAVLLKLMELCQSADAAMPEMAKLVAQDAGLTAKMLSVANSSAYQRSAPVGTLGQALQCIGMDMIKLIVISESVSQVFDRMSRALAVDLSCFWTHALQAGLAARIVAQKMGYSNSEEAYLAGLLHDVGRLVLLAVLPREYRSHFIAADTEDLCAVEERTLQTTHAQVGAWLIEQWKLDSFMADSVLYHHDWPERLHNAHPLIRIVHVAHAIASSDVSDSDLEKSGTLRALCALKPGELLEIREATAAQLRESAEVLQIDLTASLPQAGVEPADPGAQEMVEQVRSMMLASALERSFNQPGDENDLLDAVARASRILFQFDAAVIFLIDPAKAALVGSHSGEHRQRLADFVLPLDTPLSTIAKAAVQCRIAFTPPLAPPFGPPVSVIEEQLLRLFASDQLVCLPLCADHHCLAMLVAGFKVWQGEDLQRRSSFLHTFSSQAGQALQSLIVRRAESEKLSADFRMAAQKVAHEVNNPLSIIKNYLGILDRKVSSGSALTAEVSILNEEIDRIGNIINEFAEIKLPDHAAHIDINRVLADVLCLFCKAESVSPRLRIENRLQQQSYAVQGSVDALKQIFVNLIKNAAEAMPDGGLIEVGSGGLVSRDGVLYVELWVRDAGPGIDPEAMSQLFSPVKSTKGKGHSGLGLNIVHGLVTKMHGLITCRSTRQGATFEILLPAVRSETESVD